MCIEINFEIFVKIFHNTCKEVYIFKKVARKDNFQNLFLNSFQGSLYNVPKNVTEMTLQYLVTSYFMNKLLALSPKKINFEFSKSSSKDQLRVAFYPSRYFLNVQLIHSFLLTALSFWLRKWLVLS